MCVQDGDEGDVLAVRTAPPVVCVFLSKFDTKKGNMIVWSKQKPAVSVNLDGIEFKSLPSGIHEVSEDVITFVVPRADHEGFFYHGIACYKQNGQDMAGLTRHLDRSQVNMYSLGVITDCSSQGQALGPEVPVQYTAELANSLSQWLDAGDLQDFTPFMKFIDDQSILKVQKEPQHMLEQLLYWADFLGPLIFPLWKAALTSKRILILNPPGASFRICNALAHCLSVLSYTNSNSSQPLTPSIFTIGINDIDHIRTLDSQVGFIACSSDELLLYKLELYDIALKLPANLTPLTEGMLLPILCTNKGAVIKATQHDTEIYAKHLYPLLHRDLTLSAKSRIYKLTESMSWAQYIIDGFFMCTTAGYIRPSYHQAADDIDDGLLSDNKNHSQGLDVVRFFHNKNKSLYYRLKSIAEMHTIESTTIHIHQSTLIDLNLDCFSTQDFTFINELALKWFHRDIFVDTADYFKIIC